MHPNVFMKLSFELQVMCHLSKVQLRNFQTWNPMILRIFFGNKGTVLPFSYWICCFCRFQFALDFLRSWAFTATCLVSALYFSSTVRQLLTSNRLSLRLWTELVTSLLLTFSGFLTDLDMYGESTWKSITNQFFCTFNRFIWYSIIFYVRTHLKHWRLRGRKSEKAWYISALSWKCPRLIPRCRLYT